MGARLQSGGQRPVGDSRRPQRTDAGLTLRFVNTSVFSVEITLDVLLMTIIGGVGTLVGASSGRR